MKNDLSNKVSIAFFATFLFFVFACDDSTNGNSAKKGFIKVDINIPTLRFNSTVTFDSDEFAIISWVENNNLDSSYQVYIHCVKNDKKENGINAMLFKVEKDKSLKLIGDNLAELYRESRVLTNRTEENVTIMATNISYTKEMVSKKGECCTTICSNGNTMTCCNACCADPAQGCPRCCAN